MSFWRRWWRRFGSAMALLLQRIKCGYNYGKVRKPSNYGIQPRAVNHYVRLVIRVRPTLGLVISSREIDGELTCIGRTQSLLRYNGFVIGAKNLIHQIILAPL